MNPTNIQTSLMFLFVIVGRLMFADPAISGQIPGKQVDGRSDITFSGGFTVKGLPTTPPTGDSAANKSWVQGQTGTTQETVQLTAASNTITPASASDVINIQSSVGADPANTLFRHQFNSDVADTFQTASGASVVSVGTPVFSGGALDLTGGNTSFESRYIGYERIDGTGTNTGAMNFSDTLSFRMTFRPNWTGLPSQNTTLLYISNGTASSSAANTLWMYIASINGSLVCVIRNDAGLASTVQHFIPNGDWHSGELYEVEFNMLWNSRIDFYLNGARGDIGDGNGLPGNWFGTNGTSQKIYFGGSALAGTLPTPDVPLGWSNHKIEEFILLSEPNAVETRLHNTDTFYPVTYAMPGAAAGFETLTKLATTSYEEGNLVTLVNASGGANWELAASSPGAVAAQEFEIRSKFSPRNDGDSITLQLTSDSHWREISRHFEDPVSGGPGIDQVTLTAGSGTLTTLGGDQVKVFGSQTALPPTLTFQADFSDNSAVPDASNGAAWSYDADDRTDFTAQANPIFGSGFLDLNTAGFQTSAYSWIGDGANIDRTTGAGALRILYTPGYTGAPTSDVNIVTYTNGKATCLIGQAVGDPDCRYMFRLTHRNASDQLRWEFYDASTSPFALAVNTIGFTAGTEVEIELNWDTATNEQRMFVDGVLVASNLSFTANPWNNQTTVGIDNPTIVLGGMNSFAADQSIGFSNGKYSGFEIHDAAVHTAAYTAAGLSGASAAVETITKMKTLAIYREGQIVLLEVGDTSRFSITDTASPVADEFSLNGDWKPSSLDETLFVRRVGNHWVEIGRFPNTTQWLNDPDPIGDWIAGTVTTYTDVDLTDDSVPSTAKAAHISCTILATSIGTAVRVRRKGSVLDTGDLNIDVTPNNGLASVNQWTVPLVSGLFQAKFVVAAPGLVNNGCVVRGYDP